MYINIYISFLFTMLLPTIFIGMLSYVDTFISSSIVVEVECRTVYEEEILRAISTNPSITFHPSDQTD